MVDITNELLTEIKEELTDCHVISSYQPTTPKFPTITVESSDNSTHSGTRTSSGFTHSNIAFKITIYTKGSSKQTDAKMIASDIDVIMCGKYGFNRGVPSQIPNYLDNEVYRYLLNYYGVINDNTKTIYGR